MNRTDPLPPARYEATDGLPVAIALTGGGIVLGLGLVLLIGGWIYRSHYKAAQSANPLSQEFAFENGPHVTTGVARDWVVQDKAVHDHLKTYAWIDRPTGVVRIPIERATELISAESLKKQIDHTENWSRSDPAAVAGPTTAGSPSLQERDKPTP